MKAINKEDHSDCINQWFLYLRAYTKDDEFDNIVWMQEQLYSISVGLGFELQSFDDYINGEENEEM